MRVALLLSGEFRGDIEMIRRHKELLGEFDTYVACLPKYRKQWEESEWNPKEIYDVPMINFVDSEWAKHRNASSADQSGFWQYWNLCHLLKNVPEYDFYIKSRNDLVINSKLTISFDELANGVYYYSKNHFNGELGHMNDQFWVGSNSVIKVISNFVEEYYSNGKNTDCPKYNEGMLERWLIQNGIDRIGFENFQYSKNHNGVTVPSGESGKFTLENI